MSEQDYFNKDYYKILGVNKEASSDEIKKAYHTLAKKYHPHRNKDSKSAEEKFKQINEANQVLSNPSERKKYDQIRQMASGGARFNAGSGGGFEDLFGGFGGGGTRFSTSQGGSPFGGGGDFSDLFSGLFGSATSNPRGFSEYGFGGDSHAEPPKSQAPIIDKTYKISFKIAVFGATLVHTMKTGEKVKFKIKPGTESGKELVIKGKDGKKERVKLKIKVPDISNLNEQNIAEAKNLLSEVDKLLK